MATLPQASLGDTHRASEYLANERTFLAWIRTSIALVSLGFVVAKFSLWLRELATQLHPQLQSTHSGVSLPLGVILMALGGLLAVLAAWHYHATNLAIAQGTVKANRNLVIFVTLLMAALCIAMIAYMIVTARYA